MRQREPLASRLHIAVSRMTLRLFAPMPTMEVELEQRIGMDVVRSMMFVSGHPFESDDPEVELMRFRAVMIAGPDAESLLRHLAATVSSFRVPSDHDARLDMGWMFVVLAAGVEQERAGIRLDRAIRLLRRCSIRPQELDAAVERGLSLPGAMGARMPSEERDALMCMASFIRRDLG